MTGRLIHGDNLAAMAALPGGVDLVYLDPPFDSNRDYFAGADLAYSDRWPDRAAYLAMLRPRLAAARDLLSERGVLAAHVPAQVGNHVGVLLDELFGLARFVNELIWRYGKMSNATKRFPNNHDRILVYARGEQHHFTPLRHADSEYRARFARHLTGNRVLYGTVRASSDKLIHGRARRLAAELGRPLADDDVLFDFDVEFKTQDDVFYDISIVKGNAAENTGYDTQKPQALLARLIAAFTPPGGLVLDPFLGSGTTAAAAHALGRDWIGIDASPVAINTARARLDRAGAAYDVVPPTPGPE